MSDRANAAAFPLKLPGITLGVGLGAFFDCIFLTKFFSGITCSAAYIR